MRRLHLVELEDLAWWPRVLRDAVTDYLATAVRLGKPYYLVVPKLKTALEQSGTARVLDLCSGGSGPWPTILPDLPGVSVALSDAYPNLAAFERAAADPAITVVRTPVDATAVPAELNGFRTIFAAFHHFQPEAARAILADAVRAGRGIAVFEATARTPAALAVMFLTPLLTWLTTPAIRPFRWSRLFWTYLLPVVPAAVLFDGLVSCLRTYTPDELRSLAAAADPDGRFEWTAHAEYPANAPIPVTYLIGVPKPAFPQPESNPPGS